MSWIKHQWLTSWLIVGYVLINSFYAYWSILKTGTLVYHVDDAYIHLGIAKNLINNGVWGINSDHFISASSSILYTLLLYFFFLIFGVTEYAGLVINFFIGILFIVLIQNILHYFNVKFKQKILIWYSIFFFVPMVNYVFLGMETILFIFTSVWYVFTIYLIISKESSFKRNQIFQLVFSGVLLSSSRYESLFLICISSILLILFFKLYRASLLNLLAISPVIIFGIYSLYQGGQFLPNPVFTKAQIFGNFLDIVRYKFSALLSLFVSNSILMFLIGIQFINLFFAAIIKNKSYLITTILILLTTLSHATFSSFGYFNRYESYLVVLTVLLSFPLLNVLFEIRKKLLYGNSLLIFIALTFVLTFSGRFYKSFKSSLYASQNVFDQSINTAKFINFENQNEVVGIHDLGAPSFFCNNKLIDLVGLGTNEIARQIPNLTKSFLEEFFKKNRVDYIITFEKSNANNLGKIPDSWVKIGYWEIKENVVMHFDTIELFVTDKRSAKKLIGKVKRFIDTHPSNRITFKFVYSNN